MRAHVTLLTGPAGAGKTTRLLVRFRTALSKLPLGGTLWIAPTQRSAAWVHSQLLNEDLAACFNPNVFTFSGFAQRIVDANAARVVPISGVMKRVLLRRVVTALLARGRLQYFAPVADKPGFLEALSQLISELKRAETWPEDFRKASRARSRRQKDEELADVYEGYQDLLRKLERFDAEGRFWAARDLLGRGRRRPFEDVRLVVVEGFTDFTHTQYDILNLLAAASEDMFVSLPTETPLRRTELFAKTSETLQNLQQRLKQSEVHVEPLLGSAETVPAGLAHLERTLFLVANQKPLETEANQIEVLEAVGQLGEVRMLAGRIKQLLLDGVPAEDVVVVFRHLEHYASLVEEVFGQYAVPVALDSGTLLSRMPAMSSLVSLLRLAAEDWPFRLLTALLRSNYLQPTWPEWTQDARRATEKVLRRIGVASGREHYVRAIERHLVRETERSASADSDGTDSETRRSEATLALALLKRFSAALDLLPDRVVPVAEWVEGLRRMACELGFDKALQESREDFPNEGRVWQALCDALDHWVFAESALHDAAPKMDRRGFLAGFRELLSWEQLPRPGDEVGRVRVLPAAQCRALRVPYLFLGGMSEKSIPSSHSDDALYGDSERHELNRRGLSLTNRHAALADEMLLFYQVVTRAERQLVFSYPSTDAQGEPLLPGAFLEDALSAFAPGSVPRVRRDQLDPVPLAEDLYSPAAARTRAVDDALEGRGERFARLKAHKPFAASCDNVLSALEMAHARFGSRAFGPYDGVLQGEQAQRRIRKRFGRTTPFTPSQLETYALCPFRFFMSNLLGIQELESPEISEDPAARGTLAHRTLAGLHRTLNQHASAPCAPGDLPEEVVREHFHRALERAMGAKRGAEVRQALSEIERMLLVEWGESYFAQHRVYEEQLTKDDRPLRPAHFEVAFGFPDRRSREGDVLSTDEPFVLMAGAEEVRLCGQIDRLDVGQVAGRVVFNVIDYKTGSGVRYAKDRLEGGTALQLPLYALAAQQLLFHQDEAVPLAGGYWFIKEKGFKQVLEMAEHVDEELREAKGWPELRRELEQCVGTLVGGVRAAQFPVASRDDNCTSYCSYRTVCRIHQARASKKTWEAPQETAKL